ncbi:MAG: type I DNA topoisomerase [Gemmatimonadota bacterium]|nr:type I DNA topoisomerase [Gemmatimonadota bacterium]
MAKAKSALLVVESPTKAKTVGKYLKDLGGEFKQFTVKATVGHLRDLPQRELGVDVDNDFAPKYVTIRGKGKTLAELKKAAKGADTIYLATDPDREGEAIAWHVADQLNAAPRIRRVLFHEITKDAVRDAIRNPTAIDDRKVDAQQARRILDRLVGYKASPLLWKSIKTGLSAGRVQTVALRLICEREDEIRAFTPKEYWSIEVDLEAQRKKFQAKLHKIAGHRPELGNEAAALQVVTAVTGKPFVVSAVTRRQRRKHAPPPFTTSTLQQEAAKQMGFSAQRTMRTAQQLYEGVELGKEGAVGLITYMRTDSTRVAPVALEAVREYIGKEFPAEYLPAKPNVFTSRKSARAQDAHEAIRPSDVWRRPEDLKKALTPDQLKLYRLIWQRFVGSQMAPVVYDTTTIDFEVGQYLFRATGSVVKFTGYHAVFHEGHEAEEGRTLEDLKPVPSLEEGEAAKVRQITPNQHFTEPPPRYSEASLVKELEKRGIGRPSTYAAIISTLRNRDYVTLAERRFQPTSLGETVSRVLVSRFPDIFNVEFTSEMENELDKVEEGDLGWVDVLRNFYGPFSTALAAIDPEAMIREAHDVSEVEGQPCPDCGKGTLRVRTGRFGPFVACSDYPECKYTKPLKRDRAPDRPTDQKCPTCDRPMVIKTGRFGEFLACTGYPECKTTRPIPLGVKCPKCKDGELAERRTKRGRSFFGCSRYPDCDFSTWYRPTPVTCPSCGYLGAEMRSTKTRGDYRRCLACETEFVVEEGAPAPAGA